MICSDGLQVEEDTLTCALRIFLAFIKTLTITTTSSYDPFHRPRLHLALVKFPSHLPSTPQSKRWQRLVVLDTYGDPMNLYTKLSYHP